MLTPLGPGVLGSVGYRFLIIAILTSVSASTQTTILPTARTTLSMARWGSVPEVIGRIHPRFRTPTVSTLGTGAISIVWTVLLLALNPNGDVLGDAITALFHDYSKSGVNYSPPIAGIQVPIFIGVGGLILGVILMFAIWPFQREYFRRRPELLGPDGSHSAGWWRPRTSRWTNSAAGGAGLQAPSPPARAWARRARRQPAGS